MLYYKVTPEDLNTVIMPMSGLIDTLEQAGDKEKFEIIAVEMTEDEYENLPESDGF